ncbi:hypothetical protein BACOVA_02832 [Bacteroides ovatus ATCC 8483]|uniref:Uncharacterized protein n=1 Tax=Bacteroides ovatus (strain ATCC 8483 / DSM 1896 / JCM 5824 / BCRC 10623 / CCUG 4943 / NCTC 11153) TaxID=411476 RepID=A0AAN3A7W1_BACO1|nr:hypothetical protein BACOVA_02832 [Bacteroides ovatus ATCC 8483]
MYDLFFKYLPFKIAKTREKRLYSSSGYSLNIKFIHE